LKKQRLKKKDDTGQSSCDRAGAKIKSIILENNEEYIAKNSGIW
jgi:hypothetical protein